LRSVPVGRDGDIGSVVERLRTAPLVTITGSGGMGETTVAVAVAERLQHDCADGAVFVDLAAVPPRADVTRAVSARCARSWVKRLSARRWRVARSAPRPTRSPRTASPADPG
jgi:predicted ATPase